MRFYGVPMEAILREPAIRFFSLLDEAYKMEAERQLKAIAAVTLGFANSKDRQKPIDELKRISDGIMPGDNDNDYSGLEIIKARL